MIDGKSLDVRKFKAWMKRQREAGAFEGRPDLERQAEFCLLELKTFRANRRPPCPLEIKWAMGLFTKLEQMLAVSP